MPNIANLITNIQDKYPELEFLAGDRFKFTPPNKIFYCDDQPPLLLLHELGHYTSKHYDYSGDIELVHIEALAWQEAKQHCASFGVEWDEDFAQDCLDSYRNWLYANSLCPICNLSGYQDNFGIYHCPLCNKTWHSRYRAE